MSARPVLLHKSRLVLPHPALDAIDYLFDGGVHVVALRARFECDVIAAMQNHFRRVTVFLNVKDYLNLDNFWIIKMKTCHFAAAILFHGFRYAHVSSRHLDGWICISYLHMGCGCGSHRRV